uniref:Exportin-T n=1 Tax=Trypanosoma vivax (strain Y486) TaxID=1055687 RepID=G0TRP3_TRYVY|nr:putative tRNA exportin [Trypanosoma vivax Y486]
MASQSECGKQFPMHLFSQAMELTHTYQPGVTQKQRRQAEQYLMELRSSAEGFDFAIHIINKEPLHDTWCFWAFNTVMHHLPDIARSISNSQADEFYHTLFTFIYRYFYSSNTVQVPAGVSDMCSAGQGPFSLAGHAASVLHDASSDTSVLDAPAHAHRCPMDFLANKHAQMMVAGWQEFFPSRWRSFFDDAFELLERSTSLNQRGRDAVTLYVLRLFECIDERVVSVRDRNDRCPEQRARDMDLKDAMRECVVSRATAMWYATLSECHVRAPDIANVCLNIVQTYIEWVDIAFFVTEGWINLLYFMLREPAVRCAACDCLCGIVGKKQLPAVKLESLRMLNIVDSLPNVLDFLHVPPKCDDDINFTEAVVKLVREVAVQMLALYEHVVRHRSNGACANNLHPNTQVDSQRAYVKGLGSEGCGFPASAGAAVGGTDDTNSPSSKRQSHPQCSPEEQQLLGDSLVEVCLGLNKVVAQMLKLLPVKVDAVLDTLLTFIQTYIKSSALSEEQAAQFLFILYDHTVIQDAGENVEQVWSDDVIDRRKQIHNLIRLLLRKYPAVVLQHLQAVVERSIARGRTVCYDGFSSTDGASGALLSCTLAVPGSNAAWAVAGHDSAYNPRSEGGVTPGDMEAALRYMYEAGEALRTEKPSSETNEFTQLVSTVLYSERIANCTCPIVHLSYFEVLDRYHSFFLYHKDHIPLLLQRLLLHPHGVTNPNDRVRARICYLFGHIVQVLKSCMAPYVRDVVEALQRILLSGPLLPCDKRDLYETTGNLLSITLPPEVEDNGNARLIMQIVGFVRETIRNETAGFFVGNGTYSETVPDTFISLSAFAKGLCGGSGHGGGSSDCSPASGSCTSGGVANNSASNGNIDSVNIVIVDMFRSVTSEVMDVFSACHISASVRDRVAQYFTHMIYVLPFDVIKEYLTWYIRNWLAWMETVPELTKLLRILFQFTHRNGFLVGPVLSYVLPFLLEKVTSVGELYSTTEMGFISESARESREVYRHLFSMIHSAVQAGCVAVLFALPAAELNTLLNQFLVAIQLHGDVELPKLALQVLARVTEHIEGDNDASGDGVTNNCGQANGVGLCTRPAPGTGGKWVMFMLHEAVPSLLRFLLSPAFDLRDAKNFMIIGEAGQFLKTLMHRISPTDSSLSALLYDTLQPLVGADEAAGFIAALQDRSTRFSTETKMRFRNMLQVGRSRDARGGDLPQKCG